MANPAVTLRSNKGSALTFSEVDSNFQNLANATINITAAGTTANINLNSGFTVANSSTVQATLVGGTLTLQSNITPGPTFANTATVGTSVSGGTTSVSLITTGTAGTYSGAYTTDVYGRVTGGTNGWQSNITANGNYLTNVTFSDYREKIAVHPSTSGTISIDANLGPIQTMTTTGNITFNVANMSNFSAGESVTLLLRHSANTRGITSDLKFVNGTKTIGGTTVHVDAINIFYDGTDYLASTVKYQA